MRKRWVNGRTDGWTDAIYLMDFVCLYVLTMFLYHNLFIPLAPPPSSLPDPPPPPAPPPCTSSSLWPTLPCEEPWRKASSATACRTAALLWR